MKDLKAVLAMPYMDLFSCSNEGQLLTTTRPEGYAGLTLDLLSIPKSSIVSNNFTYPAANQVITVTISAN